MNSPNNNTLNIFSNQIVSLIQNTVATPLVHWLKNEKNVDVTLEEVMSVLSLSTSDTVKNVSSPDPTSKPKRTRKTETPVTGTCEFVYKLKSKQGQVCGESTTNNAHFCRKHKPKNSPSKTQTNLVLPDNGAKLECNATKFTGLAREKTMNIIIHDQPNKKPVAYAVEQLDGDLRQLNDEETNFMINSGVDVSNKPVPPSFKLEDLYKSLETSKSQVPLPLSHSITETRPPTSLQIPMLPSGIPLLPQLGIPVSSIKK